MLYITFIHAIMSTPELYPEDLDPENFYFQWSSRNNMKRMYRQLLNEGNSEQKYLRCPDLWDNNFEVLRSSIALDKVDIECANIVKPEPTRNDSGFINYSDTIHFYGIWLNNIVCLIT